jgi:hypothetical protein
MPDEFKPSVLDNPPKPPAIAITLVPGGGLQCQFPNDPILTLGMLEMAKHSFLERLKATQQDQRVTPVMFGHRSPFKG